MRENNKETWLLESEFKKKEEIFENVKSHFTEDTCERGKGWRFSEDK